MNKEELFNIIVFTEREKIISLAKLIESEHKVNMVKSPTKTLIMVQVAEPVKKSRFYLAEILASECFVEIDGIKGVAVIKGDDFEKVYAAAIIDAAHSGQFDEFFDIEEQLEEYEREIALKRQKLSALHKNTQVDFKILEDNYVD